MQKYSDVVLSAVGAPVSGAVITVTTYPDGAAATIYAADGGAAVASVTTNTNGRFSFYAANGHYSIIVSGTGITPVTYNDVVLYDPVDNGSVVVAWLRSAAGAVKRWAADKLAERVSFADFLPIGYVTDGSVDYTAALQAAVTAAKAKNAILYGVEGTFKVSGTGLAIVGPFKLRGTGMDSCILKNASGNVLRVQGAGVDVSDIQLWSQGGGHTVVQTDIVYQSNWMRHRIRQDATGYSCWDNAGFEYVDNRHKEFDFIHALSATVPGFNLTAAGGLVNDNILSDGRATNSGTQFFRVRSTNGNHQYANTFRKITFEVCRGGGIDMQAAMLFVIEDCQNWDAGTGLITDHFYKIALNASSLGSVGVIRNCGRWAGTNAASIYDVQLPGGGGGAGCAVENCVASGGGDTFTADLASNAVMVRQSVPSRMALVNASGAMVMQPAAAKPGIQWGSGLANLYTPSADTVATDGTLIVGGTLAAGMASPYGGSNSIRKDSATLWGAWLLNGNATPKGGLTIVYDGGAPNSTTSQFIQCGDTGAVRMEVRSNGGIANYSANNVNLSDERLKTDIVPAGSYWDKIKAIQVVTYRYKDQTDQHANLGVIAQQVEGVAAELVDDSGYGEAPEGEMPYKAVYQTDVEYAVLKALQEAMARIEALESKG